MLATMTKPTVAETLLDLPRDHTARRPTLEDLDAVHALTVAADTAVLGSPDTTRADVHDWLTDPDVDLSRDAWLMHDPTGALVGWSWVAARPGAANVDVDFYVLAQGRCCLPTLLAAAEQRAVEIVAAGRHDAAVLDKAVHRADTAGAAALAEAGYAVATTFSRMRIELDGVPEPPALPAGVVVRRVAGRGPEDDLRIAHRIAQESFAEHFGHVERTYDEWMRGLDAVSTVSWDQV